MILKFLLGLLLVVVLPKAVLATPYGFNPKIPTVERQYDFREFIWGVGKQDVKRYESAIFYKEDKDTLYFIERPSKRDFRRLIKYDFVDNALVSATYDFQDFTNPSPVKVIDFYQAYKNKISRELDAKAEENFIWRSKTYQKFPEFWNEALRAGDLKMETRWVFNKGTVAVLSLSFQSPHYRLTYAVSKDNQNLIEGMLPVANMSSFNLNP